MAYNVGPVLRGHCIYKNDGALGFGDDTDLILKIYEQHLKGAAWRRNKKGFVLTPVCAFITPGSGADCQGVSSLFEKEKTFKLFYFFSLSSGMTGLLRPGLFPNGEVVWWKKD